MVFESSLEQVDLEAIMLIAKFCTGWNEVSLQILATMHSLRSSGPDGFAPKVPFETAFRFN